MIYMKIADFGEIIPGARKFEGNLCDVDLRGLTNAQLSEITCMTKLWPWSNDDAKERIKKGEDPIISFWQKRQRKFIRKAPAYDKTEDFRLACTNYIKDVLDIKEKVMQVKSIADISDFYKNIAIEKTTKALFEDVWRNISPKICENDMTSLRGAMEDQNWPEGKDRKKPVIKKKFFEYPNMYDSKRVGPSRRNGRNIKDWSWQKELNFRGVQFGNWETQADRSKSMNVFYDAFCDMAEALNCKLSDISFGGELSMAFGARGVKGAAAHYEPGRQIINMSRMHGAGSLAHEWMHFVDHMLAIKSGIDNGSFASHLTENTLIPESFRTLVKSLKYSSDGGYTRFYTDSLAWDEIYSKDGNGYWASIHELLARAFACYIADKVHEKGYMSQALIGHADIYRMHTADGDYYAMPMLDERKQINANFNAFFEDMHSLGYLHTPEKAPKMIVTKKATKKIDLSEYLYVETDGQYVYAC